MNTQPQRQYSEEALRQLLSAGMTDAVQQILDLNPHLKYKIENDTLVDCVTGAALWLKKFITNDPETNQLKSDVMKLAGVNDEVLITGETGTGKEIIARSLIGDRPGKFLAVNCAGLPEHLIESELFGHARGAFTGAEKSKEGIMEAAKDGVMFLDEIGELPLSMQGKLLRALQEKRIRRVGDNEERDISCRFVCATHCNLIEMMSTRQFRKDLYARISTFHISIKPIRERKSDIEPILLSIGERLNIPNKAKELIAVCKDDILNDKIDLSLNVRSLEQMVKRYSLLGRV